MNTSFRFNALPIELQGHVASFLPTSTAAALNETCKTYKDRTDLSRKKLAEHSERFIKDSHEHRVQRNRDIAFYRDTKVERAEVCQALIDQCTRINRLKAFLIYGTPALFLTSVAMVTIGSLGCFSGIMLLGSSSVPYIIFFFGSMIPAGCAQFVCSKDGFNRARHCSYLNLEPDYRSSGADLFARKLASLVDRECVKGTSLKKLYNKIRNRRCRGKYIPFFQNAHSYIKNCKVEKSENAEDNKVISTLISTVLSWKAV